MGIKIEGGLAFVMSTPKLVFLTRNYPPTICGIGDHTYHLAQEMSRRGVEVYVICSADQGAGKLDNIRVYPVVKKWDKGGMDCIFRLVAEIDPDWVVVQYVPHMYHPKGLPLALLSLYQSLSRSDFRVMTIFHEVKIRPERNPKKMTMSFLQGQIAYGLSRKSSKIVTSIDFYAHNLRRLGNRKTVIPIGSNILPIPVSEESLKKLRDRYGIAEGAKVVCTFGNRDIRPYLPTFDKLSAEYPKMVWLLCGKNTTPHHVFASRPYIRYLGEMKSEEIYRHLSLGEVFFMPDFVTEKGEGGTCSKSGSLACAFSLGIPIIGTKGDMNNMLLVDGKNLLLTDTKDPESLYRAFISCFDSEKLCSVLGKNALELYKSTLSWDVLATKLMKMMDIVNNIHEIYTNG